jgi:peptidoglycan/LPS O-acetylase OafA/YrhL
VGDSNSARFLVRLLIGVLCAAALVLIATIGSGSELDETGGKAIGTAVALAFFSLTGVAGTNLARRRPRFALFGYLTAAVALAAFLAMMALVWSDGLTGDGWRIPVYLTIVAFGAGHASLLLGSQQPRDSEAVRLVRAGVILAIAMLCAMAIVEISSPGPDIGTRLIAVVAVLYLLGTILLPLLRRASPGPPLAQGSSDR